MDGVCSFVKHFRFGQIDVWAIADFTGDRDMEVFQADPETLRQYAPSGKAPSGVLAFAVKTGGEVILIDAGYGNADSRLIPGLSTAGFKPEDVDAVLITHMHGDHAGGLLRDGKRAFPNARVLIGKIERDFWLNKTSRAGFPERKANFDMAETVEDVYGGAIGVFAFGDAAAPGITALDARGHSPGHTAFMLESGGRTLLHAGDFLHAAALQFPRPEINARYDMLPNLSIAARARLLEMAACREIPITGVHMPFPGIGKVERDGPGYVFKFIDTL